MSAYHVEEVVLEQQVTAVVRGHVDVDEIAGFLGGAFAEVLETLQSQGLSPVGPPFGRYTPVGEGFDVEAGFPSDGQVRAVGRVVASDLPGGRGAQVVHRGSYADVAAAYATVRVWAGEHGCGTPGSAWESYLDGPDVDLPRTVVSLCCGDAGPTASGAST